MIETVKERRVRIVLIAFFLLIALAGLLYRQSRSTIYTNQPSPKPQATVVKQGDRYDQNPIVALYEERDKQNILALYEVEQNDSFRFRTLQVTTLNDIPEALAPDKEDKGVWVKLKGEWNYYNERLQKKERKETNKVNHPHSKASFKTNLRDKQIELQVNSKRVAVLEQIDHPLAVYFLTEDQSLLLIVHQNGVKISIIETK